jgi:serine/threonine-protein kinase
VNVTPGEDPIITRARSRVGSILEDKWRLDKLLGVGGMAAVYAATHRNQKRVAVKMLHPELAGDGDIRTRFLREGYAANTIGHEGAVSVLDDFCDDVNAFLVMELLDGETVEERWARKGKRLDLREVLIIADSLLDVLAAAHDKAIVHRDIKPENLFLTRQGVLKVLDFGIARIFEGQSQQKKTRAGMVMGTPAFMAPEQALAHWDEVDGRTDLWAVGATMFTLLSGRNVHEAETGNEQLIRSATTPAPSIATFVPTLPRSIVATIDRALAFDRTQRWPNARAMQEAVRGTLDALAPEGAAQQLSIRMTSPGFDVQALGPSGTLLGGAGAAAAAAATIHAVAAPTQVLDWGVERDTVALDIEKQRPIVTELSQRALVARRKVEEAKGRLDAVRAERLSMEQWFQRQVGTRTAAVDEARTKLRAQQSELARRAIANKELFGAEYDPARDEIATLERASAARAHDVALHELALGAYDRSTYKRGIVIGVIAAFVVFLLLAVPIVLRATLPVAPPPLPPPAAN